MLNNDVFPQPDTPMIAVISPALNNLDTLLRIVLLTYYLFKDSLLSYLSLS